MSAEASTWAWQQDVNSGTKIVLLCLADQSDPRGWSQARVDDLATKCGLNSSTVFRHLTELSTKDLMTRDSSRKENRRAPNIYQLHMSNLTKPILANREDEVVATVSDSILSKSEDETEAQLRPEGSLDTNTSDATEKNGASLSSNILSSNSNIDDEGLLRGDLSDPSMWPESYSLLYGIDGFKIKLPEYLRWLESKGMTEKFAAGVAYGLRDWLTNTKKGQVRTKSPTFDPWLNFTNWANRDWQKEQAGESVRRPRTEPRGTQDLKQGWGNDDGKPG